MDQALDFLKWHWGTAYEISRPRRDGWTARRKDNRKTLEASSAQVLLVKIRADYQAHPVPR